LAWLVPGEKSKVPGGLTPGTFAPVTQNLSTNFRTDEKAAKTMAKVKSKSEQEFDRTEILRYLNECGLQPVTPKSILIYLDDCLRPVSLHAVEFHLRYMRDRAWVELGIEKKVGLPEVIRWTRITANGVDEYDRRCAALGEAR
jgi:hypothetical protein